jgi:hypothetical protein
MMTILTIALIITGIHVCFLQGNVLSWLRVWCACKLDRALGLKWSRYVQKPLWDCLPCMGSFWTLLITWSVDIVLMLAVCGLLAIIERTIAQDERVVE